MCEKLVCQEKPLDDRILKIKQCWLGLLDIKQYAVSSVMKWMTVVKVRKALNTPF